MGGGASTLTSCGGDRTREQMLQSIKALKSVAEPLTFLVDQGGASFRAYIFSGIVQVIRIKSVDAWEKIMDKGTLVKYTENIGSDLLNKDDGTFHDYSTSSSDHYPYICACLSAAYKNAFLELCKETKIAPETITAKIVRQTGKIRTVLHTQKAKGNSKDFDTWNSEFKKCLGDEYDYKLLSNRNEAQLESSAFFEMNDDLDQSFVGVGMGSSSTQAYGSDGKQHACNFNSFCGCKAGKDQGPKEPEEWVKDFAPLFTPMFRTDKQQTIVLLNAIGYIYISMTKVDYDGKEDFLAKIKAGKKIAPQNLLKWTKSYAAVVKGNSKHKWAADLLMGLAMTLVGISRCKWVICERKGPVGDSLHYETSWSKYLVYKKAREAEECEAAMKPPTGKFTDEERNQYRGKIVMLQAYIIGNATQVLTLQQVQVLAGDKWEAKILKDNTSSPKEQFYALKNKEGVITRDQWEEHYSSIASLSNIKATGAAAAAAAKT